MDFFKLQSPDNELIIRWDNAPHHKHLATFPKMVFGKGKTN